MGAIPQVHIIVKNGHVSLEGVVMNQMDKNIAGIVREYGSWSLLGGK